MMMMIIIIIIIIIFDLSGASAIQPHLLDLQWWTSIRL